MQAIGGHGVASADTAVVAEWLRGSLPFPVAVPAMPGLTLRGARLCLIDGRRGAVVEYRAATGEPVSYYVVPAPEGKSMPVAGDVQRASRAGYHVVGWTEPGLLHALVANLPESRLVELARLCMKEMQIAAVRRSTTASPSPSRRPALRA
jgi:anti-sigma factor RsiW